MSALISRGFSYGKGISGNLKEKYCGNGEVKYFVEWEIARKLDNWAKQKLKDKLNITENKYLNFEGFFASNEKEANKFYEILVKILDEQYYYWESLKEE